MELFELDQLMEMPKKSEASKAKKKQYDELMVNLLAEEGITDISVKYLKSGFSFSGAKPLAVYYQSVADEKKADTLNLILNSELFKGKDTVCSFKFGLSFSAYAIEWFGEDRHLLSELIKIIPSASKNKSGETLKDAPRLLEKYFLDIISDNTLLPNLGELELKDIYIREYREMMGLILSNVAPKYQPKSLRYCKWLEIEDGCNRGKDDDLLIPGADNTDKPCSQEQNSNQEVVPQEPAKAKAFNRTELMNLLTVFGEVSARLGVNIQEWDTLKNRLEAALVELSETRKLVDERDTTIAHDQVIINRSKEETEQCRNTISELRFRIDEISKALTEKDRQIEEQTAEIAKLNSIISVYSADKQSAQSEQLNAIASKLKSEYRDFKDVENEEMTPDLGENLRFQLQSVFKILAKSGIDVEKR